jgi:CheY-like chemotaxis protein
MTSVTIEGSPKTVVVVDDEQDIVTVFKKVLENAGYRVLGFTDPLGALEHLQSCNGSYDLIISDIRMPMMNGSDFAARVRQFNATVTFLFMSAFESSTLEIKPELQIAAFLQKPLLPSQLRETVSKFLPIEAR